MNRLTSAVATGNSTYNLTFAYDAYGNMSCQLNGSTSGLCPQYSFNQGTNRISNSGFSYDASGDLIQDGSHTYQYDGEGRLASVDNGSTLSNVYNALGLRVQSVWPGNNPGDFLYGPDGKWLGTSEFGVWGPPAVYLESQLLAFEWRGSDQETYFPHNNVLGTMTIETNHSGGPADDVLFQPWGQIWNDAGLLDYQFAGTIWTDSYSASDFATYRLYRYNEGRWLTPDPNNAGADPSNPQSWNAYSYAGNDPTTNTDPTGLYCTQNSNGNLIDVGNEGESCADVEASNAAEEKNPSATVTGQPGNVAEAVAVNIGIGVTNLMTSNANTFYAALTAGQYSPNLPHVPSGSGVAANIGAIAPLVGAALIGPEGEAEDLGGLSRELGVSVNTLKHISKHLREFQKLDAAADLRQVVQLGQDIVRSGIQTGPRTFENTVGVGGSMVRVRAVLNYAGSLRSVYIVP